MSPVDVSASLAGLEHRRDVPRFPIVSGWERSENRLKRLLSCVGMSKLLEWSLPFLATMASSDAEDRRLAKDGGEVRMQTVYAYYTPNKSRRSPARGKLLALTPAIDRLLEDKLRRLNREAEPPKL